MTLPPLKGLHVLEAVIRLGNVSRAAAELGVTQPAVSQQLRVLERFFGRSMIERTARGFTVDDDVELYAARLQRAFEEIRQSTAAFEDGARHAANRLTISLLASFAQRWMIPRLIGFQNSHPEIDVRLMTTSQPTDLDRKDVDLSIRCGDGSWPGHDSELVISNRIFPVASPAFVENHALQEVGDLRDVVLIQVDNPPRNRDWKLWLAAAGAPGLQPKAWQSYATSTHALEAATAGLGVAIGHTPFVVDSLASARLVKPFDCEFRDQDGDYFLVFKRQTSEPQRIKLFRDWLLAQRSSLV
jgi:LysR family glycine cleavage system transcriptional activator